MASYRKVHKHRWMCTKPILDQIKSYGYKFDYKFLILLATICCCGCSSIDIKDTATTEPTKIKYYRNDLAARIYSVEIEGHLYVIYSGTYQGGIIHAEHCPCKTK